MANLRVRSQLLIFALMVTLPVLAFSSVMAAVFWRQQRAAVERGFLDRTRALALALDREHAGMIQTLRAVSASVYLDRGDLAGFEAQARSVVAALPGWTSIVLVALDGQVLVDLRHGAGGAPASFAGATYLRPLRSTLEPVISPLQTSSSGELLAYVGVPVTREGRLRYILLGVTGPSMWLQLLRSYPIGRDATITLLDQERTIIARTLNHERWVGGRPAPGLYERASQSPESSYRSIGLEGQSFYSAHSRAALSGWTVATGVPSEGVEASPAGSARALVTGASLALLLAVGLALVIGTRIARPVMALAADATSLGQGRAIAGPAPVTGTTEVDEAAAALRAAERMIHSRDVELTALLAREEAANRAKDQFLALLSHELRTPLNAVCGWATLLQTDTLDPDTRARALTAILRNARSQVQLIDDLLDVSRVITGKMRLDVRQADLTSVIEAALDSVRPAADAKGVRIQSVLDPRAEPIRGDPDRLQQVAWNLLMNAVKFTPKGGRVQVHLQRVNSHVEIVVSDSGEGIAPDVLPHIFERFMQADSGSARAHGGLGLGLALVRHLIELHGGTVTARSAGVGQGASFTVSLPVALAAEDAQAAGAHPRADAPESLALPAGTPLRGVRVLVVDDDADSLDLATTILGGAGAEVRTAGTAVDAYALFLQWSVEVLICDIELPGEDGYSLIRRIRTIPPAQGGRTPAIAVTAYGRVTDRVRSARAGFDRHLPKPVDPMELVAVVAGLAGRSGAPPGVAQR